eukprot:g6114.t1
MQNLFATVLLEELGIVVENRREVLSLLSVVVVQDGESLNVLGIRIRLLSGHGNLIYYFPLEEVATWARRTRMLLLGNEFNQIHFAHLEHHVDDELEDSANVGGDYDSQEFGQEVEQELQLEEEQQELPQDAQLPPEVEQDLPQVVQLVPEVEQEVHQDVQLIHEVEQEEVDQAHALQEAHHGNILQAIGNIPQQQVNIVEGMAHGMVVVEEMPDVYGEQENVNPNIMDAPIAFVGIPFHEGVAIGVPQNQVVHVEEPPMLPPQPHDQIIPIDIDNGGLEVEAEIEELEEFEIQVVGVEEDEIDGDGDVVMMDVGVADEGVDVQQPQLGHRYPLRDTRARREYQEREQQRRDRAGDRNEGGRRVSAKQPSGLAIKPKQSSNIKEKLNHVYSGMHQTRRSLQIARWFCRQEAIVSDVLSVAFIKFDEVEQNAFIAQVLHDPVTSRFPTSLHFRRKLLREAIRRVEYHGQPLTDDLVSEYTNLLLPNTNAFNGVNHWSYKTFTYGNFQTKQEDGFLQVRCSRNMLEGETGCKEWEAGILLGEYILNHHSLFKDRIVMELGCGVGLTGVCVMRQNPFHLILTDGNEEALDNCRRNLESNDICLSKSVSLRKFLWSEECEETPEIIIGSDLLYDTSNPSIQLAYLELFELFSRHHTISSRTHSEIAFQEDRSIC